MDGGPERRPGEHGYVTSFHHVTIKTLSQGADTADVNARERRYSGRPEESVPYEGQKGMG